MSGYGPSALTQPTSEGEDDAADDKLDGHEADADAGRLLAAVDGVVAVVTEHEEVARRHHELRSIVVGSVVSLGFKDAIGGTIGKVFDIGEEAVPRHAVVIGRYRQGLVRTQLAADQEPSVNHLNLPSRQANKPLHTEELRVARQAKDDNVAPLRHPGWPPPPNRQLEEIEGVTAVAIGDARHEHVAVDRQS